MNHFSSSFAMKESQSQPSSGWNAPIGPPLLGWRTSATRRCPDMSFNDINPSLHVAQWARLQASALTEPLCRTELKSSDPSVGFAPTDLKKSFNEQPANAIHNLRAGASEFAVGERQQRMLQKIDDLTRIVLEIRSEVANAKSESFLKLSDLVAGVNELRDDMNRVRKLQPVDESSLKGILQDHLQRLAKDMCRSFETSQQALADVVKSLSRKLDSVTNDAGLLPKAKNPVEQTNIHYPSIKDHFWTSPDICSAAGAAGSPKPLPSSVLLFDGNRKHADELPFHPRIPHQQSSSVLAGHATKSSPLNQRETRPFPPLGSFQTLNEDIFLETCEQSKVPKDSQLVTPSNKTLSQTKDCDSDYSAAPWELPAKCGIQSHEMVNFSTVATGTGKCRKNTPEISNPAGCSAEFSATNVFLENGVDKLFPAMVKTRVSKRKRPR